jgi:hypothetical protein
LARIISIALAFGIALGGCGGSAFSGSDSGTGGSSTSGTGGILGGSGGRTGVGGTGGHDPCATVDCAYPVCPDGVPVFVPEGQCCPICSCQVIACAMPICPPGVGVVTPPGECCPVCESGPAASCSQVLCDSTPPDCPKGYVPGTIPGACCAGCVPTGELITPPICTTGLCPLPECQLGYRPDQLQSECCPRCQPDPKYCQADSDCVVATNSRNCCACPEAISIRLYEQDACWRNANEPRDLPESCYPPSGCTNVLCAACQSTGPAACIDHQCTLLSGTQ